MSLPDRLFTGALITRQRLSVSRCGMAALLFIVFAGACSNGPFVDGSVVGKTSGCGATGFVNEYTRVSLVSPTGSHGHWPAQQWQAMRCMVDDIANVTEAERLQWQYADRRSRQFPVIGYKVALGGAKVQALFGVDQPVVGVLFSDTVLSNGQSVNKRAGGNLAYEPDLLAIVKDTAINDAGTIYEVANSIDRLVAFLEIPDLLFKPLPQSGPAFIATNAAVRFGVVGDSIAARATPAFLSSMATMQVVATDQDGHELSRAPGRAVMGHPYNAILFLLKQLKQKGVALQVGDMISLGAYAPPKPVGELQTVRVSYEGIGDNQQLAVTARFIDIE